MHPLPFVVAVVDAVVSLLLSLFFNATYHQSKSQENALIRAVKLWTKKKNDDDEEREREIQHAERKKEHRIYTAIKI